MLLKGGTVLNKDFELEKKDIYIEDGKISERGSDGIMIDISGLTVVPGLIDTHFHGFAAKLDYGSYRQINASCASVGDLKLMCGELVKRGITTVAPGTNTLPKETLLDAHRNIATLIREGCDGAEMAGIFMEGPFISPKRCGGMRKEYIRPFDAAEFEEYWAASEGNIKMVNLAPEIPENFAGIKYLKEKGIVVSIGHTDAVAEEIETAIAEGATSATHLYNAMRGMTHREPGVVGTVLDSDGVFAELICDGHHINEKIIRLTFKMLGRERLVLVSDSVPVAGLPDGEYTFDGKTTIVKDGTNRLPDGTLGGNVNDLFECVRRVVKFGIPLEDAVYSASYTPAKRLGLESHKGSIDIGKDADLVVVDNDMNIRYVIKKGIIKYGK